jgi:deoxycytidylate deaminase
VLQSSTIGSLIATGGNVGIGTTAPVELLTLDGVNPSCSIVARSETETASLYFGTPFTGEGAFAGRALKTAIIAKGANDWSKNNLHFCLNSDTLNTSDKTATLEHSRMVITNTGNVGIGTTSPSEALHISNAGSVSLLIQADSDNVTEADVVTLKLRQDGLLTGVDFGIDGNNSGYIDINSTNAGGAGSFHIRENSTSRMTIALGGNVGIGITSPTYRLQLSTDSAGKPNGGSWANSSDERLKENIQPADLDLCYDIVKSLPLKRYRWKENSYTDEQIRDRAVVGWIAQDVISVFPKAVEQHVFTQVDGTTIEDCLTLNETMISRTLYGCVQKLITEIENKKQAHANTVAALAAASEELQLTHQELSQVKTLYFTKFPDEI